MKKLFSVFLFFCFSLIFSQVNPNDTIRVENLPKDSIPAAKPQSESQILGEIDQKNAPATVQKFSPTKAGLYSAVLPGLGQYYNKKYWKIPIVWGAVGTGVGIALWNDKQYKRYRNAFVAELNGLPHEFSGIKGIDKTVLGNAQDSSKRQRDYAIGITGLIYILNIMDAVVDAHLYEGRHDPDLAIVPSVINDQYNLGIAKPGLTLSFRF
ncbi:hypothetical protein SAMN05660493_02784 [Epilithonimonas bovis DSM 19482]|jgi:hypothetical protein|uniref:DUF5683 domain-containing protein n=1 Tax=Epilithonimonas bovis DSM 19482 TaxID=1121284 RepID=A0A1U7Q0W0_9FLAO|nr:DUF5683 domain-containing protein [Epilithonimonas bovis]SIT98051.1 hypothetical protein SAMN05660493_02784 [Epilithonimonas bovis DSM 19482]HBR11947.1 hypothetical protein [Chryseobacterium sp.]